MAEYINALAFTDTVDVYRWEGNNTALDVTDSDISAGVGLSYYAMLKNDCLRVWENRTQSFILPTFKEAVQASGSYITLDKKIGNLNMDLFCACGPTSSYNYHSFAAAANLSNGDILFGTGKLYCKDGNELWLYATFKNVGGGTKTIQSVQCPPLELTVPTLIACY